MILIVGSCVGFRFFSFESRFFVYRVERLESLVSVVDVDFRSAV